MFAIKEHGYEHDNIQRIFKSVKYQSSNENLARIMFMFLCLKTKKKKKLSHYLSQSVW